MEAQLYELLATVVTAIVTAAVALLANYIRTKTKSVLLGDAANLLQHAVEAGVRSTQQTFVDAIKKASADGTLTAEEKAEAMRKALRSAKDVLGEMGARQVAKAFGIKNGGLDKLLEAKVEAAVGLSKPIIALAKPPDPSPGSTPD